MSRYFSISKGVILSALGYRRASIVSLLTNLVYTVFIFFIWQAIFKSRTEIQGLTFDNTFIYLVMASLITNLYRVNIDWGVSSSIITGTITKYLLRPLGFKMHLFFESVGSLCVNFVTSFLPSLIIVIFFVSLRWSTGYNILFFIISFALSYMISFNFDFTVGLSAFYTESLWGIRIVKDIVIQLLSGAIIPLTFFPDKVQDILMLLPFQAIYNSPLSILIDDAGNMSFYISIIINQLFWLIIIHTLNSLLVRSSIRRLSVNGG